MRLLLHLSRASLLASAALALAACRSASDGAPAPSASAASAPAPVKVTPAPAPPPPPPPRNRPATQDELATTSPNIFLGNMKAQLGESERLAKAYPTNPTHCRGLSGEYNAQGKLFGDLDQIQKGIDVMSRCIALEPQNPDNYVDLANQVQSLHRFKDARAYLAKAKELHGKPDAIAAVETELDYNDGRYDAAIPAIRAARATTPSLMTLARDAQLDHDLGQIDEADREFQSAEALLRDTSPVPLAWLYMQRGMHLVRAGKLEDAVVFFRASIERLPTVAEREHLAEALHLLGQDDEAQAIYEDILKTSTDPEFTGALAAIYRGRGRVAEANALRAKATQRYGELLQKYPQAMYWHASEYFMGEGGDPKKALELLQKNLELRPNATSYVALARAELANGDVAGAEASITKALGMPLRSGKLFWTAARVYAKKGDAAKADDFAARARALDPRIELTEPPRG